MEATSPIGTTSEGPELASYCVHAHGGSRRPAIEGRGPSPRVAHPGRVAPAGLTRCPACRDACQFGQTRTTSARVTGVLGIRAVSQAGRLSGL